MIEVAIRENGGQPKWISLSEFKKILRSTKSNSPCPPKLNKVDGFERWWKLYDYKKAKSKAEISWNRHVKKEFVEVVINHTKQYVEATPEKQFRKHPTTYLNQHSWNDEITKKEAKVDLDQLYPLDKTGNARLGRCAKCNGVVFANKFNVLNEDSSCCKAKINQYR